VNGIGNLRTVDQVHHRLKDGDGDVLVDESDQMDVLRKVKTHCTVSSSFEQMQWTNPLGTNGAGSIGLLAIAVSTAATGCK
jgi:hypothetical protein